MTHRRPARRADALLALGVIALALGVIALAIGAAPAVLAHARS